MSVEYDFKLKRKGTNVEEAPTLFWYGSTIARELYSYALPDEVDYDNVDETGEYGYYTPCTKEDFAKVFDYLDQKINELHDTTTQLTEQIKQYLNLLPGTTTEFAYEEISDDIADMRAGLSGACENLTMYQRIKEEFKIMYECVFSWINKDNFEIVRSCG